MWRIKQTDELNEDELDEFYCKTFTTYLASLSFANLLFFASLFCRNVNITISKSMYIDNIGLYIYQS